VSATVRVRFGRRAGGHPDLGGGAVRPPGKRHCGTRESAGRTLNAFGRRRAQRLP